MVGVCASPVMVFALTNLGEPFNLMCTGVPEQVCGGPLPNGVIAGVCLAKHNCKATHFGVPGGEMVALVDLPAGTIANLEATGFAVGETSGIGGALESIGSFISKNPLVSGIGLGAGMSLLQSMMSGGGGGSGGSGGESGYGGYGTGICTTQYYYSASPNPADPCAIYSPSGTGSTLPTTPAPDTDILRYLSGGQCQVISSLISCPAGEVMQEQGQDTNGCRLPPICVAAPLATSTDDANLFVTQDAGAVVPVADLITNQDLYVNTTSSSTPDPSQTPLAKNEVPQNGLRGDLLSLGGGVTIYARSRTGNTEVSGFYGGSGSAGGLCTRRPWSNNFLSYIIPPTFFDNLCKWGGFGGSDSGLISGSGLESGTRPVVGPRNPPTSVKPPSSELVPEAHIRASPESVNLGGRTTVFWVSRNVASCEESSSDGNFHGTTQSGGASTVSLSGPVTFYIDCLGLSGERVSDSFTVQIGI